jgi:uncharacterized repeat protein (TIGR03837 family)
MSYSLVPTQKSPIVWDIFCRVIDYFGDAGVCWRLSKILQNEHGITVRLWIDDLATLQKLLPALDVNVPEQFIEGVYIHLWITEVSIVAGDGQAVIEAMGCGLPQSLIQRMACQEQPPIWIILEYLSAEVWVDAYHGLASPPSINALERYFFFPGFSSSAGGLLREHDLIERRSEFDWDARCQYWRSLGCALGASGVPVISLFAYPDSPVEGLLEGMRVASKPMVLVVPEAPLLSTIKAYCGVDSPLLEPWTWGGVQIWPIQFLAQSEYDNLLWACDINFVRGEDSFVRAQWAARPMVWQPYRQTENTHALKLQAFLDRYLEGLPEDSQRYVAALWHSWNSGLPHEVMSAWQTFWQTQQLPVLRQHAINWQLTLEKLDEMSAALVKFVCGKVK